MTPPYPITWRDGFCVNNHPITPEGIKLKKRGLGQSQWFCRKCNTEANRRTNRNRKGVRRGKAPEPVSRGTCTLDCGHSVVYSRPIPRVDDIVPCLKHYGKVVSIQYEGKEVTCLLYTSDAADERSSVDL